MPVLVDDTFTIIDGHHRVKAAKELGMEVVSGIVKPCGMQEAEALALSANLIRGTLDPVVAGAIFADLGDHGWSLDDMEVTGLARDAISALLASPLPEPTTALTLEFPAEAPLEKAGPGAFVLEIHYATQEQLREAKRRLKKLAGKGGDVGLALLAHLRGDT